MGIELEGVIELADCAQGWPVPVRSALRDGARCEVDATPFVTDRALDLGTPVARAQVLAVAEDHRRPPHLRTGAADHVEPYDAAVSWGACAAFPDLVEALAAARTLLRPGAWLLFAEPVGRPGVTRLLQASIEARRPELRDLHLGRDLNAALREAGFTISRVHRSRVDGVPLLLRYVAYGRACAIPDGATTDPGGHA